MRTVLGQFLHDLRKIDCRKKVAPRELGDHVDLLLVLLAIRQDARFHDCVPRRALLALRGHHRLRVLGELEQTVPEKAKDVL